MALYALAPPSKPDDTNSPKLRRSRSLSLDGASSIVTTATTPPTTTTSSASAFVQSVPVAMGSPIVPPPEEDDLVDLLLEMALDDDDDDDDDDDFDANQSNNSEVVSPVLSRNVPTSSTTSELQQHEQRPSASHLVEPHQPSIHTVGQGDVQHEQVLARYDYEPQAEDELALSKGDLITILCKSDANWWKGQTVRGIGVFPSNYVEPLASATVTSPSSSPPLPSSLSSDGNGDQPPPMPLSEQLVAHAQQILAHDRGTLFKIHCHLVKAHDVVIEELANAASRKVWHIAT
jgi:hypothetical protein